MAYFVFCLELFQAWIQECLIGASNLQRGTSEKPADQDPHCFPDLKIYLKLQW